MVQGRDTGQKAPAISFEWPSSLVEHNLNIVIFIIVMRSDLGFGWFVFRRELTIKQFAQTGSTCAKYIAALPTRLREHQF
jgi:hypothetical protein